MQPNEFAEFENRVYLNPTTSRDEQIAFIDTLRETQKNNTDEIIADTYALGTQVPSRLGGLGGAEDTFIAQYQTPQMNQTVANLRAAAQQSALTSALNNLQNAYKKRYQDALNASKKGSTGDSGDYDPTIKTPDSAGTSSGSVASTGDNTLTFGDVDGNTVVIDSTTGKVIVGGGTQPNKYAYENVWDAIWNGILFPTKTKPGASEETKNQGGW